MKRIWQVLFPKPKWVLECEAVIAAWAAETDRVLNLGREPMLGNGSLQGWESNDR